MKPLAPPGPSLYEMAALTNELDTMVITTKVKEILLAHNVGQKVKPLICSNNCCVRTLVSSFMCRLADFDLPFLISSTGRLRKFEERKTSIAKYFRSGPEM